jgi:hypothetical protein
MDRRRYLVLAVLVLLAGCAANGSPAPGKPVAAPGGAVLGALIPPPHSLPHSTSFIPPLDVVRNGSEFETGLPSGHASISGTKGVLQPNWIGPSNSFSDLAFAIYSFKPTTYDRNPQVRWHWSAPPASDKYVWIGLADWAKNRWEWYPGGNACHVDLASMAPYLDASDTNHCLVAVVALGTAQMALGSIRLGSTPPVASLNLTHGAGFSPVSVGFDCTGSYDPDTADDPAHSIIKYEWDFYGDGTFETTSATPDPQTVVYTSASAAATYYPVLRVTDSDGIKSTAVMTVEIHPGWQHSWGAAGIEQLNCVGVDSTGNVYTAGRTESFGATSSAVLLIKTSPAGECIWKRYWCGASGNGEGITSLTFDAADNIYLAGSTESLGTVNTDGLVQKWDPDGNIVWTRTWGGAEPEELSSITYADGAVYALGYGYSWGTDGDLYILKFDPAGNLQKSRTWSTPQTDFPIAITPYPDPTNLLAVTCWTNDASSNPEACTFLLDADCGVSRIVRLDSGSTFAVYGSVADSSGNRYLAGKYDPGSGPLKAMLCKLDSTGNLGFAFAWVSGSFNSFRGVAIDGASQIRLIGNVYSEAFGAQCGMIATCNSDGLMLSALQWGQAGSDYGLTSACATPTGGLALVGPSHFTNGATLEALSMTGESVAGYSTTSITGTLTDRSGTLGSPVVTAMDLAGQGVDDSGGGATDASMLCFK